ncbi:MAG: aminotransferase class I/II-fold pyridoxal phosphate-dependent enzyme [Bacteroidales bacterium]
MIYGHGDDLFSYPDIQVNFSSNCYGGADHTGLEQHLVARLAGLIRSYPHPDAYDLKELIARKGGLLPEQVSIFNGATEAIYAIARMRGASLNYILGPTFSEYEAAALQAGSRICKLPALSIREKADYPFETGSSVWICNPNNPDGRVFEKERLLHMIRRHPEVCFIIDQSYADFTDCPVLLNNEATENVILINSLTKQYAIPGLRLGYVIASTALTEKMATYRMPWSVNALAIEAGKYLLADPVDFGALRRPLHAEVKRVKEALCACEKYEVYPTDTHFFLVRIKGESAARLKETLAREHGLLIRNAENFAPHYAGYFRIAVRTPEENDLLINALLHYATHI